jgi:hypothetical protein
MDCESSQAILPFRLSRKPPLKDFCFVAAQADSLSIDLLAHLSFLTSIRITGVFAISAVTAYQP